MLQNGEINWIETLASIATDKGQFQLAKYIREFQPISIVPKSTLNITVMPEATCDGCQ